MKSKDLIAESRSKLAEAMMQAAKEGNAEAMASAFTKFADEIQEAIVGEARALMDTRDTAVLAQRGCRQLTGEETEYYQAVIGAMKSTNSQQALTDVDKVLPKTVIDAVFDEIRESHPLLDMIDFHSTGGIAEFILSTSSGVAGWGDLCATIDDELTGAFSVIDLTLKKLSAYVPVCNAMLDLGPVWLDRYARTILAEALASGLEAGTVDGDGKDGPLGMTRKLSGDSGGVFPQKTPVSITDLGPTSYGTILDTLSKTADGKRRDVPRVLLLVNPADYFTKVFPATTIRSADGTYVNNALPYPTDVIRSSAVPSGKAVFGIAKKYFAALGTSKGGKLEKSEHAKFLEDQTLYRIKLYGNGRARDENAFVLADISGLKPAVLEVKISDAVEAKVTEMPEASQGNA